MRIYTPDGVHVYIYIYVKYIYTHIPKDIYT